MEEIKFMLNRDTLLISSNTREERVALSSIFENNYNILQASNLHQTNILLEQYAHCISATIIDVSSYITFSDEELTAINHATNNPDIPILAIVSNAALCDQFVDLGVSDIIIAPYSSKLLQRQLQNVVDLNSYRLHLDLFSKEQATFLQRSNESIVDILSSIIEYRSLESGQHIFRIRHFTEILLREVARSCPEYHLDEETIQIISSASSLHDIGKISIPDAILNKPGPLTDEERNEMQTHTTIGHYILESLSGTVDDTYLNYARQIAYCHHERWDGNGYPEGLKGDEIPICAQVVGLTDAYDALTSKRIYKEAYQLDDSINMILNGECGVFSPKLLECFKQVTHTFADLAIEYRDGGKLKSEPSAIPSYTPSEQPEINTFEMIQLKYQSLLHHIGSTVLEIDLDQWTYHVVYNPDSNLTILNSIVTVDDLAQIAIKDLLISDDIEAMKDIVINQVPDFFQNRLRRQHHYLHMKNPTCDTPICYRITLIRIDPTSSNRRRILMILENAKNHDSSTKNENLNNDFLDFILSGTIDTLHSIRHDAYLTLSHCSKDLVSLLGYTKDELKSQFQNHMANLIHPYDRERVFASMEEQLNTNGEFVVEFRVLHKSGNYIWVLNKGTLFVEQDGQEYLYCQLLDNTKNKEMEEKLQETLERQEIILSQTENVIFECDMKGDKISFSNKWKEMFGYDSITSNLQKRMVVNSHFHPDDAPAAFAMFESLQNGSPYEEADFRIAKSDGRYIWCKIRITLQYDRFGNPLKMIGSIVNINEIKRTEQELKSRAEQDALTHLLNKEASKYYIDCFLESSVCREGSALLVIDLDNFKQVNDQYGHMFGDIIITQAAEEIHKLFRTEDIIGRIGGDEFIVFMKNIPTLELLKTRLQSLLHVFATTLHERVPEANLGCSIGVALYPQHGATYEDLFLKADQALYQAKARGKNGYQIYELKSALTLSDETNTNTPIDSNQCTGFSTDKFMLQAFHQLYSSKDIEATINTMLNLVGQQMNVSRMYIFENNNQNTHCSNTFEWCNSGVPKKIDCLQNLSYVTDLPDYQSNFNEQGIFYCVDITTLPKQQYDILSQQGTKSILQCAIYDDGKFRGFVGFDECNSNRLWTQQQIDALLFFSKIVSSFLLKKRTQDEATLRAENLTSVLEHQNSWVYVIDLDTFELLYVNDKAKALSSDIKEGDLCYRCIVGLDHPCPNCPARIKNQESNQDHYVYNKHLDLHVHVDSSFMQWNGRRAYLVTCREKKTNGQIDKTENV